MAGILGGILKLFDPNERDLARLRPQVAAINALEPQIRAMSDEELRGQTARFKDRIAKGETLDDVLVEAFATAREAARRALGERPHDVQLMGAMVLHGGRIAEMRTGEGKTLTATIALYLNSLAGKGAHLVTTNDFLVKWQAQWMGQVYEFLGVTVGYIQEPMDAPERQAMYGRDITYVQNSELGFDYLRDNMAWSPHELVLRDLHYAIVDEVDSILVDEARTPLIISGRPMQSPQFYEQIDRIVRQLRPSQDMKAQDGDYIFDEKQHSAALTDQGQEKVERLLNIPNLSDPDYLEIRHHIDNSLKAHILYKKDDEYVVMDGEVIIVDENTGHLQPGRRYSDGLHQAIEAKEHVRVEQARQTVASITYQNFFRLYTKLAGMTGTAKTEEGEFVSIYKMPVVVVPTNKPVVRKDSPDIIFKTLEAKYRGIVSDILRVHVLGQPVLVGTRSVDVSEYVSRRLAPDKVALHCLILLCQNALLGNKGLPKDDREKYMTLLRRTIDDLNRNDIRPIARVLGVDMEPTKPANLDAILELLEIADASTTEADREAYRAKLVICMTEGTPHAVLNARQHEKEGEIIAEAGQEGAVTIATNMAGRGVDIVLGGRKEDADHDAKCDRVRALGGLHILGTERHESRRIDNQLRGRSGRQGDPGSSAFYISLDDELMRLFGPERFGVFMRSWPDEEALAHKIVSRSLERAQQKVEMRNFDIRKNTLKYDDVMNTQRKVIYAERRQVLLGEDLKDSVLNMLDRTVMRVVDDFASPQIHPSDRDLNAMYEALRNAVPGVEQAVTREGLEQMDPRHLGEDLCAAVRELYAQREAVIGSELMREIERSWLLRIINNRWMQHLQEMDHLRDAVFLRAYGQLDPLIQYQKEGFSYFETLLEHIAEDMIQAMFLTEVVTEDRGPGVQDMEKGTTVQVEERGGRKPVTTNKDQPKRNDPCPCGSGKKYKKCCMP
jgi:preprotein translocase subunit SecA